MDINNYSIYAAVSVNGNNNETDLENVLGLIGKFEEISKLHDAKDFLEKTWKVTEDVNKFPIGGNCVLSTNDNDKYFSINFDYNDKNLTYCYKK